MSWEEPVPGFRREECLENFWRGVQEAIFRYGKFNTKQYKELALLCGLVNDAESEGLRCEIRELPEMKREVLDAQRDRGDEEEVHP